MFCIKNNNQQKCFNDVIRLNNDEFNNGFKIDTQTLNLKQYDKKQIRLTNIYKFDNRQIIMIWNNNISLQDLPVENNKIKMYPKLDKIWINVDGNNINGVIPNEMLDKMKNEINKIIASRFVVINDINVNQLEMLNSYNININSNLVFEKLLIYIDLRTIASQELLTYSSLMPDDIDLICSFVENDKQKQYIDF